MADWNETPRSQQQGFGSVPRTGGELAGRVTFDEGLRKHMLSIYNYMSSGVLLTGIVALLTARSGLARSEEHTSELQSLMRSSYAVFCLKKKKIIYKTKTNQEHTNTLFK